MKYDPTYLQFLWDCSPVLYVVGFMWFVTVSAIYFFPGFFAWLIYGVRF